MTTKFGIQNMQELAQKYNGKCLSTEYINLTSKLLWECEKKHQWEATPRNIKRDYWCPECKIEKSKKMKIIEMQLLAKKNNGKFLSEVYINRDTKLLWECEEGHQWETTPRSIKKGHWCPICTRDKKKITIKEIQNIVGKRGGKCLSEVYINSQTKLAFECEKGHQWDTIIGNIKKGHWCPECAKENQKLKIEEMQRLAEKRGGKCLSKEYFDIKSKLLWECEKGHQWEASWRSVKNGTWCKKCLNIEKLQQMQKIAEKRGGKCLSKEYISIESKLLWECEKGHQWEAVPTSVKKGTWCPICANEKKKLKIEEMNNLAKNHGGKCLSKKYFNNQTKLLWECEKGHQWEAIPTSIKKGCWCDQCGKDKFKLSIEEMQEIANLRGGRCISKIYVNSYSKLLWECEEGHQWEALPTSIKKGSWCPICSQRNKKPHKYTIVDLKIKARQLKGFCLSEVYTRVNDHYKWQCEVGHNWEASWMSVKNGIWCKVCLKIEKLHKMQKIAEKRSGKCLSEIYINNHSKLLWECEKGHKFEAMYLNIKKGDWCPKCSRENRGLSIEGMQIIAEKRDGKCLSKEYINGKTKLLWECEKGHQWEATPDNVKGGAWCPECLIESKKLTIEEMREIARIRGGKCISDLYVNVKTKLHWECEKGHQWEATPDSVKKGTWCPECGKNKKKLTIEEMQEIAKLREGKCLSEKYVNSYTKLLWECEKKHQWETTPYIIKNGSWCPECLIESKKLTIEDMQEMAKLKRGKCLSDIYINSYTKLLWECEKGHKWETIPWVIKRGSWCPECAINKIKSSIEKMREIAKKKGGKCLSDVYIKGSLKLLWECEKGHQWEATPENIKRGSWCPNCANQKNKLTILDMQELAKNKEGKCLSKVYKNIETKLQWECKEGHKWETTPKNIKSGSWCPICRKKKKIKIS